MPQHGVQMIGIHAAWIPNIQR